MNKVLKGLMGLFILISLAIFPVHSQPVDKKGPKAIPPEYTVLAIYSVEARGVSQEVADGLTPHLVFVINKHRGKVQVVQNEAVEKALEQVGLAASGACTDTVCLPELGKILGANRFLVSSITKLGERYTIYMTVFDAETGIEVLSDIEKCKCPEDELGDALERLTIRVMARLNGKKAEQPPKPQPLQPEPKPEHQGPPMIQGNLKANLIGHGGGLAGGYVVSVAFSPDGKLLASGSLDKTIKLWDVNSGTELRALAGHPGGGTMGGVSSVAFSADGKTLASGGGDNSVKLWDVASGKELTTLGSHKKGVYSVAYSPDGKMLASGSKDKTIKLWDPIDFKEVNLLKGHKKAVLKVTFSPDGKILASVSDDKTLKLWDTASGSEIKTINVGKKISSVAFHPTSKLMALGCYKYSGVIKLLDSESGDELRELPGHKLHTVAVAFSPDGLTLVSTGGPGGGSTVVIWDVETGKEIMEISGVRGTSIATIAFSPNGRLLALGGAYGTIRIFE